MKIEFTHHIPKEKEKTYYTVPFTVPENTVKFTVSYEYERGTKGMLADLHPTNTVDLGLADENGNFLGWSGSAHKSIYIGEYGSSKGYLAKPVTPGEWQIIVGAYHIVENGVDVKYTIEFEEKHELLLYGDLHIHSDASDGKFDIPTLAGMAKDAGLDFIGIANHNNYSENLSLPHTDGLTFIPAVEWTHYNGHMNFFGVAAPFENSFIANDKAEMEQIIAHARSLGAVISVNHPKCPFCPYTWENDEAFDMMEIWNGPMTPRNLRAVEWWTELLKQGRKIAVVGGSDYHKPGILVKFASPVTAVTAPSRSAADILNSIKRGHSFVAKNRNGAKLNMRYGEAGLGDTARYSGETKLEINAEKLGGARLVLVTESGEKPVGKGGNIKTVIPLEKTKFAYIKAVRGTGKLTFITAISNPIYFSVE